MLDEDSSPKEDFVAEDKVTYNKSTSEGAVSADDNIAPASNLPPPPEDAVSIQTPCDEPP
jgi:hypothetical protein